MVFYRAARYTSFMKVAPTFTSEHTVSTVCPLDCPDLCGLRVTVDDGRVTRVDGDRRSPITDGFICGKVRKLADHLYCDERVLTPLIRTGPKGSGSFRAASWRLSAQTSRKPSADRAASSTST
jgi:anaerobic selenocysteine-containing dehydrogenase